MKKLFIILIYIFFNNSLIANDLLRNHEIPKPNGSVICDATISATHITIDCINTSTMISVSMTDAVSYLWESGETTANITVSPTMVTTYKVTVTDNVGCTDEKQIIINHNTTKPNANAGVDVTLTCTTPSTILTASGGGTYAWDKSATQGGSVTPTTTTTYTVTVTGTNGCTATDDVTVTVDKTQPNANAGADVTVTCSNSSTTLTASGGGSYEWNNSAAQGGTVTPTTTTTYTVIVTGANGCTATDDIKVTVDKIPPTAKIESQNNIKILDCQNTSIELTASGGSTYLWSTSTPSTSTKITVSKGATYTVTVTDNSSGCTNSTSIVIDEDKVKPVLPKVNNPNTITCANDKKLTLDATSSTANVSYKWENPTETTATKVVTEQGVYKVTITNTNNKCSDNVTFEVNKDIQQPTISLTQDITITCKNLTPTITTTVLNSNNNSYVWFLDDKPISQNTKEIKIITEGTYKVIVTNKDNQCSSTTSTKVGKADSNTKITPIIKDINCFGDAKGEIKLSISGGVPPHEFLWSNGAKTDEITGLKAGTYKVTVTDGNNCINVKDDIFVKESSQIVVTPTATAVKCNGENNGKISVQATGGVPSYEYSRNNVTYQTSVNFDNLFANKYTIYVKDSKGCIVQKAAEVTEPAKLSITPSSTATTQTALKDGTAKIEVSGGTQPYNYSWKDEFKPISITGNETMFDKLAAGDYFVTVTDKNFCVVTVTITVKEADCKIDIDETNKTVENVSCYGLSDGSVKGLKIVGAKDSSNVTIKWRGNIVSNLNIVKQLPEGNHQLEVKEQGSCKVVKYFKIEQPKELTFTLETQPSSCGSAKDAKISINAEGGTKPYSYNIINTQNQREESQKNVFENLSSGKYKIYITDAKSCKSSEIENTINPTKDILIMSDTSNVRSCDTINGYVKVFASEGNGGFSYQWNNIVDVKQRYNSAIYGLNQGTYIVTVTDAKGCSKTLTYKIRNDFRVPIKNEILIKPSKDILYANPNKDDLAKGICYQWLKNDTILTKETKNWIYIGTNDFNKYKLNLYFKNNTGACDVKNKCKTTCDKYTQLVSNNDVNSAIGFELFPNPNNGRFTLRLLEQFDEPCNIKICNLQGQEVFALKMQDLFQQIEISDIAAGLYVLHINNGKGKFASKKIVVYE